MSAVTFAPAELTYLCLLDEDELDDKMIDKYLKVELIFGIGTNSEKWGRVIKQSWGLNGNPTGHAHFNPLFDTHKYKVKFTYGMTNKYQANIITKNMYAQVHEEG